MRFNSGGRWPEGVSPDDDRRLELSTDFLRLGRRLTEQSRHLSAVFPPAEPISASEPRADGESPRLAPRDRRAAGVRESNQAGGGQAQRLRSRRGERSRFAAVVAISTAGIVAWFHADGGSGRLTAPPVTLAPPSAAVAVVAPLLASQPWPSAPPTNHQQAAEAVLRDVSGPELEGLLDLWEQEDIGGSTVSI